jgi:uncharacterized membrane protein YcaP (DUF421 family)
VVELGIQFLKALAWYSGLLVVIRFAGKRLAGQTTTVDLIVLITLGVVIQTIALQEGTMNALVFVATVFAAHRSLTALCARYPKVRHVVRGSPRALVRDGVVLPEALDREGISSSELSAGLRKLGYESAEQVSLAVLEETGHISAVGKESDSRRPARVDDSAAVRP